MVRKLPHEHAPPKSGRTRRSMHPLHEDRRDTPCAAKIDGRTARNVLTRRGFRFFSSLTGTTTAIDSPHPPTGSSKASEGLKPTAAAEEERRASCARQEEQRPASCAGQEEQRPQHKPAAARRETRPAYLPCRKPSSKNRRGVGDGSVIRRTFAPLRRAPFRLSGPCHCIVQDRKSSRAMRGTLDKSQSGSLKDRRVVGDGSVIRRTFAPLRRAPFRLSGPGHCIVQDRKSSRAMRGTLDKSQSGSLKDRRVVGDGSVIRRTFAPLRRASFRLVAQVTASSRTEKVAARCAASVRSIVQPATGKTINTTKRRRLTTRKLGGSGPDRTVRVSGAANTIHAIRRIRPTNSGVSARRTVSRRQKP